MASSRSHCIYIFTIQQEFSRDKRSYFFHKSVICLWIILKHWDFEQDEVWKTNSSGLGWVRESGENRSRGKSSRRSQDHKQILVCSGKCNKFSYMWSARKNKPYPLSWFQAHSNSSGCSCKSTPPFYNLSKHTHCSRNQFLKHCISYSQGGNARTALLCCCSPSAFNASESLSTLRFGARYFIPEILRLCHFLFFPSLFSSAMFKMMAELPQQKVLM